MIDGQIGNKGINSRNLITKRRYHSGKGDNAIFLNHLAKRMRTEFFNQFSPFGLKK
jgi:hypothetical protein